MSATTIPVTSRADLKASTCIQIHSGWEEPWNDRKVPNGALVQAVHDLGVGHVRDSLWVRDTGQQAWHAALADMGVKLYLNIVDQRKNWIAEDLSYLSTLPYADAVVYVGGQNEPNSSQKDGWPQRTVETQQRIYQAAARYLPAALVCGPALKHEHVHDYDKDLRDLAAAGVAEWVHEGCLDFHFYPGSQGPVANDAEHDRAVLGYGAPVGFHTETGWKDSDLDETTKARFCVEAYLRDRASGIRMTSLYSLGDDTTGTFGIAGKPAAQAIANLLAWTDGGEDFPGWLAHPSGITSDTSPVVTSEGDGVFTVYLLRAQDLACTLNVPQGASCDLGEVSVGGHGRTHYTIPLDETLTVATVRLGG